jgi:thiamine-monophosphate kinase
MKTLRDIGELDAIRRIARLLPAGRNVVAGIGDDCAVVRPARSRWDVLYTTDAVIESVHFGPATNPRLIGHKAAGRVLSDIASMGGEPLYLLINLVAPRDTPVARIERIYRGMVNLCATCGAAIVGGDTAAGRALELHVFGVGRVPRGRAVLRSGARPGDAIYVTGELGGSLRGRHLAFEPRLREGRWLRAWATAMVDVSDGLVTDLRHMADAGGVGADLRAGAIPVSRTALGLRGALTDGEDFELLFTVPKARAAAFERGWARAFRLRCSRIGEISQRRGIRLEGRPLRLSGFEHFRRR